MILDVVLTLSSEPLKNHGCFGNLENIIFTL